MSVDVGGWPMRVPCYSCEPDPRDARIAELEAQLHTLAEAVMDLNGGHPVSPEALDLACSVVLPDDAVLAVAAERALGRRK